MSIYIEEICTMKFMIKNNVSTMIGFRKMTIADTAKLAGLKYNTVYNLYHDNTKGIEFETLNKLCWALDCTPNDLLRYVPDENPPV